MTAPKSALLLVGSAKSTGESTSESIGAYLLQRLSERGVAVETRYVARSMRTAERTTELLEAADQADLILLAFPLYVDSLPYLATRVLERLAAHRLAQSAPPVASFMAIANCGFPEPEHNLTALAICAQFAQRAGYAWAGGLALGAGGAISGRALSKLGGMVHNITAALDLAAEALAAGNPLPDDAADLLARPILPKPAYVLMGDLGWLVQARQNRVLTKLNARPFASG